MFPPYTKDTLQRQPDRQRRCPDDRNDAGRLDADNLKDDQQGHCNSQHSSQDSAQMRLARRSTCAPPGFSHPNTHGVVAPNMALLIWALAVSNCSQRGSLRLTAE